LVAAGDRAILDALIAFGAAVEATKEGIAVSPARERL
jgi:hypothetical protein